MQAVVNDTVISVRCQSEKNDHINDMNILKKVCQLEEEMAQLEEEKARLEEENAHLQDKLILFQGQGRCIGERARASLAESRKCKSQLCVC